jgi:hypothetical protein
MFTFNPDYPDATNSQKWEQIRNWRNAELKRTDWTQIADSTADKAAWATYRQALRDLPTQDPSADKIVLPELPD